MTIISGFRISVVNILIVLMIIYFVYRMSNEIDHFCDSGANCGDPQRFPTYKQQGWSYLDAIPPPDFFHRIQGPGPLDGYIDSGVQKWADLQKQLKRDNCNCADKNFEMGF